MSRTEALVLRAAALWTFFVWGVFLRNLLADHTHTTGFKVVHTVLAAVSLAFGLALWRIASHRHRRAREEAGRH